MRLVDSHCHAHFDTYDDPDAVLKTAAEWGVDRLICVGVDLEDSQKAVEFAQRHENVWASAGVHPHEADKFLENKEILDLLSNLLNKSSIIATGEIGLDYYRSQTSKQDQEKALRAQIEIGLQSGKPFIFHVRDAWDDFWRIYDDYQNIQGVIHSFSAGSKRLDQILIRGLYVGLNGIMTFTKDEAQLVAAKQVPLETDAPFLTPVPYRGDTCEPKHVKAVADFLAELRQEQLADIAAATTSNAEKLFNL
jgi:TatD DNase family protein